MADSKKSENIEATTIKPNNTAFILISIVGVLLITCVLGFIIFYNSPSKKMERDSVAKFEEATQEIEAQNYDSALALLNSIDSEWSEYASLDAPRIKALKGFFDVHLKEYKKDKNYEGILAAFYDNSVAPSADDDLKSIYTSAKKKYVKQVKKEVKEYSEKKNNKKAILLLNDALTLTHNDDSLKQLRKETKKTYRINILKKARKLYKAGKYDEANQVIYDALEILPDNQKLLDELEKMNNA